LSEEELKKLLNDFPKEQKIHAIPMGCGAQIPFSK